MEPHGERDVSRQWLEVGYGKADHAVMRSLMSEELLERAALPAQIDAFHLAFPDLRLTIDEQVAEGAHVATRTTVIGTHTGPLFDIPPTGKRVTLSLVEFHTVVDGRIVEAWNDFSLPDVFMQLGLIQMPS